LNELVTLIGVLIGTGGLASLLSGASALQRTRRLQRKIRVLHDSSALFEPGGQVAAALEAAKALTALDLAASTLMKSRVIGRITFGIAVLALTGGYTIWIGMGGDSPLLLAPSTYKDAPLVGLGTAAVAVAELFWLVRTYLAGDLQAREQIIRTLRTVSQPTDHLAILDSVRPEFFSDTPAVESSTYKQAVMNVEE
jgi:hypothetical protein